MKVAYTSFFLIQLQRTDHENFLHHQFLANIELIFFKCGVWFQL